MSKKSVLKEISNVQDNVKKDPLGYTSHLVVGIDVDNNNFPQSTITISAAKPLELIGMCDHLIGVLKNTKKNVIKKLSVKTKEKSSDDDIEKMISALPKPIADKMRDFKKRMDKAVENNDLEEMEKVSKEIRNLKNPFEMFNKTSSEETEKDDEDFNIEDFK